MSIWFVLLMILCGLVAWVIIGALAMCAAYYYRDFVWQFPRLGRATDAFIDHPLGFLVVGIPFFVAIASLIPVFELIDRMVSNRVQARA